MGRPLLYDVAERPITSILIIFCSFAWLYIQKYGVTYQDIGINYVSVLHENQYWRLIVASLSHISFLHLVFNMSALWSIGTVELSMGALFFIKNTLCLLALSGPLVMGIYHILIVHFRMDHFKRVTAVGYSCVVFGWMAILAVRNPSSRLSVLGLFSVPMSLAPFESLIMTSLIVPQASFVGHLSGIFVGYALSWGLFQDFNGYWTCVFAVWLFTGTLYNMKTTNRSLFPFVQLEFFDDSLQPISMV